MNSDAVATFYSGIEQLTKKNLLERVKIGLNSWIKNQPKDPDRVALDLEKLPEAIDKYWNDPEHGFPHTLKLGKRLDSIFPSCPNVIRSAKIMNMLPIDIEANLSWSAILHDLGYFFGYSFADHQKFSAELAKYAFFREVPEFTLAALVSSISHHDYFSPLVNKTSLPTVFMDNPLAEIFRLADKTTGTAAEEVSRYYLTGKLYNRVYYDPTIPLERRLDLNSCLKDVDQISVFLYIFSMTPLDFLYTETSRLYHEWETSNSVRNRGKRGAYLAIKKLTLDTEKLGQPAWQEIKEIYREFFKTYNIPRSFMI